jgi:hypothetical protein
VIDDDGTTGHSKQAFVAPLHRGVYRLRLEFQRTAETSDVDMFVFQCKDGDPEWWKNQLFKVSSRK